MPSQTFTVSGFGGARVIAAGQTFQRMLRPLYWAAYNGVPSLGLSPAGGESTIEIDDAPYPMVIPSGPPWWPGSPWQRENTGGLNRFPAFQLINWSQHFRNRWVAVKYWKLTSTITLTMPEAAIAPSSSATVNDEGAGQLYGGTLFDFFRNILRFGTKTTWGIWP